VSVIRHTRRQHAATDELRKARRNFEFKLAQNVRSDKKSFFAYMRSKSKCNTIPGPLINQSGELLHEPMEMSEEFNKFWLSGNVLDSTSCEKDLGVWISSDLKLTHHITEACKKS